MEINRDCPACKGTGKLPEIKYEGGSFAASICYDCKGRGDFPPVDIENLLQRIKGRKAGTIKSVMTSYLPAGEKDELAYRRAYYVWRMARFHGGKDMTMPVVAAMGIGSDPFIKELNEIVDAVAKTAFGSNMRAAYAWRGLI